MLKNTNAVSSTIGRARTAKAPAVARCDSIIRTAQPSTEPAPQPVNISTAATTTASCTSWEGPATVAATISGNRLGLAMAFLVSIAGAFVVSATRERVRPMLRSTAAALPNDAGKLADTPFATMPETHDCAPLKRTERANVVFVLAASQFAQILVVAVVTTTIYLILGLIVLSPELLNEWTHTYKSTATVLGLTLPVPDSLIHMTLFLGALTFMYISARAAGDAEYRSTFLDPLIDDLRTTLIARNRYRGAVALAACSVDGGDGND